MALTESTIPLDGRSLIPVVKARIEREHKAEYVADLFWFFIRAQLNKNFSAPMPSDLWHPERKQEDTRTGRQIIDGLISRLTEDGNNGA